MLVYGSSFKTRAVVPGDEVAATSFGLQKAGEMPSVGRSKVWSEIQKAFNELFPGLSELEVSDAERETRCARQGLILGCPCVCLAGRFH